MRWHSRRTEVCSHPEVGTAPCGIIDESAATFTISGKGDCRGVVALTWSRDGRTLALLDAYRYVRRADLRGREPVALGRFGGGALGTLAWSPDGSLLVAGGSDPVENPIETDFTIRIWDVAADRQARAPDGQNRPPAYEIDLVNARAGDEPAGPGCPARGAAGLSVWPGPAG